jgi:hypothetical protein
MLSPDETCLIGNWSVRGDEVVADDTCLPLEFSCRSSLFNSLKHQMAGLSSFATLPMIGCGSSLTLKRKCMAVAHRRYYASQGRRHGPSMAARPNISFKADGFAAA